MLTKLAINNFRGIHHLEIEDLSKVNILVGTNGAGKTSILEAVALMANALVPNFIPSLGIWREMPTLNKTADYSIRTLFSDLDISKKIDLAFTIDDQNYSVEIKAYQADTQLVETISAETGMTTSPLGGSLGSPSTDFLDGITLSYFAPSFTSVSQLTLTPNGHQTRTDNTLKTKKGNEITSGVPSQLGCFYIHARRSTSAADTARVLTQLFERKKDGPFLNAIRSVDNRVARMTPGTRNNQPVVLVDIGLPRLIPVNALGDGFCRMCLILTGVASQDARILVVDEIDSGLHSSVMEGFWHSLLQFVKTTPIQIFCTTHNEEMLRNTLKVFKNDPNALRIFRLDKKKDGETKAQKYTFKQFLAAEEAGLDVR